MKKCEFCLRRCLRRLVVARSLLPAGTANTADGTGKAAAHGITMGTSTEGTITAAADGGMADGGRGAVRAGNCTPRPVAGFGPAVEQAIGDRVGELSQRRVTLCSGWFAPRARRACRDPGIFPANRDFAQFSR